MTDLELIDFIENLNGAFCALLRSGRSQKTSADAADGRGHDAIDRPERDRARRRPADVNAAETDVKAADRLKAALEDIISIEAHCKHTQEAFGEIASIAAKALAETK